MELINLPEDVFGELVKLASIDLCSNLNGQICTALMMNPPQVRSQGCFNLPSPSRSCQDKFVVLKLGELARSDAIIMLQCSLQMTAILM